MIDVAVGIDIGTSYTKAAARAEDGTIIAVNRICSPQFKPDHSTFLLSAAQWWACLKHVLRGLLTAHTSQRLHATSICVSAIAPTLTVFDAAQGDKAYAILYSSLAELDDEVSLSQNDPRLTERRLMILRSTALNEHFVRPCLSDLVGYINWRLSGELTINSISLAETGMFGGMSDSEKFAVLDNVSPRLVAPAEQIGKITVASAEELGIEAGIPVCGGCPDTISSAVGAGLEQTSEKMLYLGTFGSLMRLEADVNTLLNGADCQAPPFTWMVSVPGLGPEIEILSQQWFGSIAVENRLRMLDQQAVQAVPGAGGTLFLVPRWKEGMISVGTYQLVADRKGEIGNVQRKARAVLEGLAYAVIALNTLSGEPIKVGGGGARSHAWLDALSLVFNCDVKAHYMAWEATGPADIAARLAWQSMGPKRPFYISQRHQYSSRTIINDNCRRIKGYYHEQNWL